MIWDGGAGASIRRERTVVGDGSGSEVVSGSEFPIEEGGGGVDGLFAELGIDIEGGRDLGVTEEVLGGFCVYAALMEDGSV